MTRQAMRDARTHARSSDPVTSLLAADQSIELAKTHERLIRAVMADGQQRDADAIGALCGLSKEQVCRRLKYMMDMAPVDGVHGISGHGRPQRVWRACK